MNILVISDLHANYEALQAIRPAVAQADLVVCLGDLVGYYCQVNEVLDFMRGLTAITIRGNHDEYLLSGCPPDVPEAVRFGVDYANRVIDPAHRRWLAALPLVWGGMLEGRSLLLSHGSPFRPLTDYLYPNKLPESSLEKFDFDVLAFGQTHRPLIDTSKRPIFLNPGSVGQSRLNPGIACAARLSTETLAVEPLQYSYDNQAVMDLAIRNGAGKWITKHLTTPS